MNKEIGDFRHSIVTMGESWSDYRIHLTRVRESAQATSQRMDNIQPQVTSICLDLDITAAPSIHVRSQRLPMFGVYIHLHGTQTTHQKPGFGRHVITTTEYTRKERTHNSVQPLLSSP